MDLKELKRRKDYLAAGRSIWDAHAQEIVDHIAPDRQGFISRRTEGEKTMTQIYDETALHASDLFARGVFDLMCNPATKWFGVAAERRELNEAREAKIWLDMYENCLYVILNKSNYYSEVQELFKDWGDFGTGCQYLGQTPRSIANFRNLHLGDIFVSENSQGQIDTLYRQTSMTARQILQDFPDTASMEVQKAYKDNPEQKFEIIHAVLPREDLPQSKVIPFSRGRKRDNKAMPWASVYFETSKMQLLSESGYREFPFMVPRMRRTPGEVMGRGLGMIALPGAKGLNRMTYDILRAGSKRVDPPLLLSNDAMINPLRRNPEAVNILRTDTVKDKFAFLVSPHDPGYEQWLIENSRQSIKQIYFNDLLELVEGPDRTAFEVAKLIERKLRLLGGSYGQLQAEYFNRMFDRLHEVVLESGYLPTPPQILWGEALKIDYLSPLARAQQMSASQGIVEAAGFMAQVHTFYPEIIDIADWDEAGRQVLESRGVSPKIILPAEDVAKMRQARAKQQQEQQMAAMAMEAAKTMPALSKGPEPGSPIDQLNQQFQQGAGNA